ncbi:hypothetical protein AVEN_93928-1 [Araneus ventricosus]|uniref:Uncharacterized protein n=1 Tax=Araneus ventricosus TaxID=182803 RepID=A0A4Y2VXJ8_ARAVE|nr:hypothetical protein AVEN_103864-1 [Araneus ventricosus]GBO30155.1 hypothetical protein AVEN_93928-1 [Araneus ventricosus]
MADRCRSDSETVLQMLEDMRHHYGEYLSERNSGNTFSKSIRQVLQEYSTGSPRLFDRFSKSIRQFLQSSCVGKRYGPSKPSSAMPNLKLMLCRRASCRLVVRRFSNAQRFTISPLFFF